MWQGSGEAWPGTSWADPVHRLLVRLGWRVTLVPWGATGAEHRGRAGVLHVFSGGEEPVGSGSAAMLDRLAAVAAALGTAQQDGCAVVGICLGAQMIAAAGAGLPPRPVAGGGEAGLTTVRGAEPGVRDLVVATAHVAEVPEEILAVPGVRHLWSNPVTTVQGFGWGERVVGVQFHPELSAEEGRRAALSFRQGFAAPPVDAPDQAVDPRRTLQTILRAAGAHRLVADRERRETPEVAAAPAVRG
ncbi:Glutamine amidotransferase class-I [Geodermatophilus ruber]|uniref:Glutamine amidotransferase class-I n=1 Tax=Geodermatophilus ruber TaxID=504800 RepID=A0A1I4J2P9_9ACTN|nr:Glutamine amidotransferase class-I [Geodermatophilus ruber]